MVRMTFRRRALLQLAAAATAAAWPMMAQSAQRRSLADPFRLAVDDALADSGLAAQLQRRFGRDTGVAIVVLPGPARELLDALGRGEHDGALLNTPQAEAALDQFGLLRDRRQVATSDFLIVGPMLLRPALDALGARTQAVPALAALAKAGAPFLGATPGCGTQELEADMWRAAKVAPLPPWYRPSPGRDALATAHAGLACTLVERGVWAAADAALRRARDFGVLVEGDPLLQVPVHLMRSFHVDHPAGKLLSDWLASRAGRRAIAALPAYRPVAP